jgi:hypothetical protein
MTRVCGAAPVDELVDDDVVVELIIDDDEPLDELLPDWVVELLDEVELTVEDNVEEEVVEDDEEEEGVDDVPPVLFT